MGKLLLRLTATFLCGIIAVSACRLPAAAAGHGALVDAIYANPLSSVGIVAALLTLSLFLAAGAVYRKKCRSLELGERKKQAEVIEMLNATMNAGQLVSEHDGALGALVYVNDNLCAMLGYSHDELWEKCGGTYYGLIYHEDAPAVFAEIRLQHGQGKDYCGEFRMEKKDGSILWVQGTSRSFVDGNGAERSNAVLVDITRLKSAMEELRQRAEYDETTGIYNKFSFYRKTRCLLDQNPDVEYTLIRLHIKHFKVFNDIYGVAEGDVLLRLIGQRLKDEVGNTGTYGRLQADHFAVCVPSESVDPGELSRRVSGWLNDGRYAFAFVPNFGIYAVRDTAVSVDLMCDRAALALNSVKGNYVKSYAFYNQDMRRSLLQEQEIINEMHGALEQGQFDIYLQPQFNYASGKLVGAEALVRWNHPERGVISPGQFVPIFESNGFISRLDEYVWERACQELRRWLDAGQLPPPVSVNISRVDICSMDLCAVLTQLLEKYQLPATLLRLEITESAYVENPIRMIGIVRELQKSGFFVEMDDFGSGYSSLNMLKDVPVDLLKLDMKFLSGDETGRGGSILNSIIRMAKWLNLPVLAEGVETAVQAEFLKSIGCELVQGYYYARPLPAAEFEELLRRSEAESGEQPAHFVGMVDPEEFWDPDGQTSLVFNHFVGGAGVFEYYDGVLEGLRINDKFFRQMELECSAVSKVGKNLLAVLPQEAGEHLTALLDTAIQNSNEVEGELNWPRPDQSQIWLHVRARLITKSPGRFVFYLAVENITKWRLLTEKAEQSYEQLQNIMDSVPARIVLFSIGAHNPRILYANEEFCRTRGQTRDQLMGSESELLDHVVPEDKEYMQEGLRQARMGAPRIDFEYRFYHHSGEKRFARIVAARMEQSLGNEGTYLAFISDVTEIKTADKTQREEAERYRIIVEQTATTVVEWDYVTGNFYYSRSFKNFAISQLDREGIHQLTADAPGIHPEDRQELNGLLDAAAAGQRYAEAVVRMQMADGSYQWARLAVSCQRDAAGKPLRTIGTINIVEEEIQAKKMLEGTTARLSSIIANLPEGIVILELSHPLKTVYISERTCSLFGLTTEEYYDLAAQKRVQELLPDLFSLTERLRNMAQRGENFRLQLSAQTKTGEPIFLRVAVAPTMQANGVQLCYLTVNDISDEVRQERTIEWQGEIYRLLLENSDAMLFDFDTEKRTMTFFRRGKNGSREEYITQDYFRHLNEENWMIHPDYTQAVADILHHASARTLSGQVEYLANYDGAGYRWYRAKYRSVVDQLEKVFRIIGEVVDIQKEVEEREYQDAMLANTLFAFEVDLPTRVTRLLRMDQEQTDGFLPWERYIENLGDNELVHPNDRAKCQVVWEGDSKQKIADHNIQCRIKKQNGRWVWICATVHRVKGAEPDNARSIVFIKLIDEEKRREDMLRKRAELDAVTGLYNRAAAEDRINAALGERNGSCAFLVLDVDGFKEVNDTYGHPKGDVLLRHIGELMRGTCRKSDIVARIGGDEFAALLLNVETIETVKRRMDRFRKKVGELNGELGVEEPISVSLGLVMVVDQDKEFGDVFARADQALYIAKKRGKNCIVVK